MSEQDVLFEIKGKVAYITLNRPQAKNSLTASVRHRIEDIVDFVSHLDDVWGLIITGSGNAFSSGADISAFPSEEKEARRCIAYTQALFNKIENLSMPVIAALNGYALGGGLELALSCDIRIMSEKAQLGLPEVKIGAFPCAGGTQCLTRIVGPGIAKELIFTGRLMSADEAFQMKIVNHVTPAGKELEVAQKIMHQILANSPQAVSCSKECINRGQDSRLEHALELERNLLCMLIPTHDLREGSQAFLEKRSPHFQNR